MTVGAMEFQTVEEFETAWLTTHSGIARDLDEMHAEGWFGYRAVHCDMEECDGWHMGTQSTYEMECALAALIARNS